MQDVLVVVDRQNDFITGSLGTPEAPATCCSPGMRMGLRTSAPRKGHFCLLFIARRGLRAGRSQRS